MGMVIHSDFWEAAQAMPEKQRPGFIYAICAYTFDKTMPKGNPSWLPTFIAIKQRLDMSAAASERGRAMANARWNAGGHAQANAQANAQASEMENAEVEVEVVEKKEKVKEKGKHKFEPPSEDEVLVYAEDSGFSIDASRFCDYYAAQGWKLSNGNKMKDWRAAARNWSRNSGRVNGGVYHGEYD